MINKIIIVISVGMILLGVSGVKMQTIRKRMIFLCISSIGGIIMSFAEGNAYGLLGGIFQIIFRFVSLILLIILFFRICKKNEIAKVSDINGIGRGMPYTFMAITIFAMMVVGIPATGTFTGIFYSELGLLAGDYGVFAYIGMLGNMFGIIVPAALLLPILREAYFPDKDRDRREIVRKIGKRISLTGIGLAVLFIILCIYQKPVLAIIGKILEGILS